MVDVVKSKRGFDTGQDGWATPSCKQEGLNTSDVRQAASVPSYCSAKTAWSCMRHVGRIRSFYRMAAGRRNGSYIKWWPHTRPKLIQSFS